MGDTFTSDSVRYFFFFWIPWRRLRARLVERASHSPPPRLRFIRILLQSVAFPEKQEGLEENPIPSHSLGTNRPINGMKGSSNVLLDRSGGHCQLDGRTSGFFCGSVVPFTTESLLLNLVTALRRLSSSLREISNCLHHSSNIFRRSGHVVPLGSAPPFVISRCLMTSA